MHHKLVLSFIIAAILFMGYCMFPVVAHGQEPTFTIDKTSVNGHLFQIWQYTVSRGNDGHPADHYTVLHDPDCPNENHVDTQFYLYQKKKEKAPTLPKGHPNIPNFQSRIPKEIPISMKGM